MKATKSILTIAALVFAFTANAQLNASYYAEVTHISPKHGVNVTYSLPGVIGDIQVGLFYQQASGGLSGEVTRSTYEKEFYGLVTSFTLAQGQKLELDAMIRMGNVNQEFFTITPAVIGYYSFSKHLQLGAGLGVRSFRPTMMGGLTWKF